MQDFLLIQCKKTGPSNPTPKDGTQPDSKNRVFPDLQGRTYLLPCLAVWDRQPRCWGKGGDINVIDVDTVADTLENDTRNKN